MQKLFRSTGSRAARSKLDESLAAIEVLLLGGALLWITPRILSAAPPDYRFVRIATTGKPAPGGGTYGAYFEPHAVNKTNSVLFVSDTTDGKEGIYLRTQGRILKIARTGDPEPGGTTFGAISMGRIGLSNTGELAFGFLLPSSTNPIGVGAGEYRYKSSTKKLTAVVIPEVTEAPGGGKFAGVFFNTTINDNNDDSVFPGIVHGYDIDPSTPPGFNGLGVGLFRVDKQYKLHVVVKPGDAAPGGRKFDWAGDAAINDSGDIAFGGHLQGDECIGVPDQSQQVFCYTSVYIKGAGGTIRTIAHQGDPAPGGGFYRVAYGPVINNRHEVVYLGDLTPPPDTTKAVGLFLYSGGIDRIVVRPGDTLPNGGSVKTASRFVFDHDINNRGDVSFAVKLNEDRNHDGIEDTGMYVLSRDSAAAADGPRVKGTLKLVARTGTFIPGIGTIKHLGLAGDESIVGAGRTLSDTGRLLLWATMTDGLSVLLLAHPKD